MKIEIHVGCVLGIGVLTAIACEDLPTEPPEPGYRATQILAHAGSGRVVTADDQMEAIAADVPGFGGFYLGTSGRLIVRLVDRSDRDAAASALRSLFADERYFPALGEADVSDMVVVSAKYSFPQLRQWRRQLDDFVFSIPQVAYTDVNEQTNTVLVAVTDAAATASVQTRAHATGIPTDALSFSTISPIRAAQTLNDTFRPAPGGILQTNTGGFTCTLGFNVKLGSLRQFLTNSHCTQYLFALDFGNHYQPGGYSNLIGHEAEDRIPFTHSWNPECPTSRPAGCRYSDAAFVTYENTADQEFAKIARPADSSTTNGTKTVDSSNPRFTITQRRMYPIGGEILHKVGVTTGWTFGPVTVTCLNMSAPDNPDVLLICQDEVRTGRDEGDSGAPVFVRNGSATIGIIGLLHGAATDATGAPVFFMSSVALIQEDFERTLGVF